MFFENSLFYGKQKRRHPIKGNDAPENNLRSVQITMAVLRQRLIEAGQKDFAEIINKGVAMAKYRLK